MHKAHGEQDEIGLEFKLAAGNGLHVAAGTGALQGFHLAVFATESSGQHREVTFSPFEVR
jgi:hypothetical protein